MQRRASRRQPGCVQLFSRPSTALNVAGAKVHLFTTDRKAQTDPHLEAGRPVAVMMAFGALAGGVNAMHAAVSARASGIAPLRAVGFGSVTPTSGKPLAPIACLRVEARRVSSCSRKILRIRPDRREQCYSARHPPRYLSDILGVNLVAFLGGFERAGDGR